MSVSSTAPVLGFTQNRSVTAQVTTAQQYANHPVVVDTGEGLEDIFHTTYTKQGGEGA